MMMKRVCVRLCVAVFTAALLLPLMASDVLGESFFEYYFIPEDTPSESEGAGGDGKIPASVYEGYSSLLESLPTEIVQMLDIEAEPDGIAEIADGAKRVTDFDYLLGALTDAVFGAIASPVRTAALVVGILLLAAVARAMVKCLNASGTEGTVGLAVRTGICLSLFGVVGGLITLTEEFTIMITSLMSGTVPFIGMVYTAAGNGGTAAVQSGGISLMLTLSQALFSRIMLPSVRICFVMSVVGTVFPDTGIKGVAGLFRKIATGLTVVCMTLLSFVMGLQTSVAQSADSFAMRGLKYLVGNLVPIVGSAVADTVGTVGGGISVIKSAGGGVAVVAVLVAVLPTLAVLLLHSGVLALSEGVSVGLDLKEERELLSEIRSTVSMMCAYVASVGVAFIYVLTLFMRSGVAISW